MRILVVNGPNLSRLGMREPAWYGRETLEQIMDRVRALAAERHVEVEDMQSDSEGELVAVIGRARERFDGVVINPAAYTHTSVALRDAIAACGLPVVEVHLTNTHRREPFRHASLTVPVCLGQVMGFGGTGYLLALEGLLRHLQTEKEKESNT
ncbi:MAG TPA: type II 3-dehydroquinate dehydratase [Kiritimatiellia bacterium]|nr:type II 3-dehydroquinate dehydratase [Kiritimatiellia bacterium]HOR97351.1 type II 3-dehydroquinate dehydratase [Kiritimatiellia bacterium]HPK38075.1 type II 3-dehydroquinate dehydratase [Kiritimatiellia bacterium]HPW75115.1 type II 3-dehydroquinate dehydratase [Kiritimatiellia bacterium]HRU18850.1 type II 3-dehydroquinate dehydratase [Kiritimatiellia bacterium]